MSQSKTKKLGIYIADENGNIISLQPADVDLSQVFSAQPLKSQSDLTKLADSIELAQGGLLKAFQQVLCDHLQGSPETTTSSDEKDSKKTAETPSRLKKKL